MERGKVAFSLGKKAAAPRAALPAARAFEDDEEDTGVLSTRVAAPLSKLAKRRQEAAEVVDPTAFEYDGVYDKMKAVENELRAANSEAEKGRKSKYMSQFMQSAEVRERDRLRAESKMLQRERATEGDAYAGKEAFVTSAYKEQQEELRKAEEEERIVEARERSKNRGVASFHQRMLKDESDRRQAAVEALAQGDIRADEHKTEITDKDRAARAAAQGLHVELNEDNQIVDRRDLLSTGLNVLKRKDPEQTPSAPPTSARAKRSQLMEEELLAKLLG